MEMGEKAVLVSNLHPMVRLEAVMDIFSVFGEVVGFRVHGDGFVLRFETFPERSLVMNNFPLARRRMKVAMVEWEGGYDTVGAGNTVVFEPVFDTDEVRDECCMFADVMEVVRKDSGIYVVCRTDADARSVLMNMYGRYYNKARIRCRVVAEETIPLNK